MEIAGKSQIAVQAQEEVVNVGSSSSLFFPRLVLVLHCFDFIRARVCACMVV